MDWLQNRQRVLDAIVASIEAPVKNITQEAPLNLHAPKIVEDKAKVIKPVAMKAGSGERKDIDCVENTILVNGEEQVALPLDAIKLASNRVLGYQRRTQRIDNAITRSVGRLIATHQIVRDGDMLKMSK